MIAKHSALLMLGAFGILCQFGCSGDHSRHPTETASADSGPLVVYVTNYPLKFFADRIGGQYVAVRFPAPPDIDPAYWVPDSETISEFQQADLILFNGAGYEGWAETASLPRSKICVTSDGFSADYIALENAVSHSHGPEGEHAHGATAFTTWLDPTLAVKQAKAICDRLETLRPAHAEAFRAGFNALRGELEALDRDVAALVSRAPNEPVVFSHPVYQYFERRYGINGISVHWEPDEAPTDAMWSDLEQRLKAHPARWMIWEGQPLADISERLAKQGLSSIVFAPVETPQGSGTTWKSSMRT